MYDVFGESIKIEKENGDTDVDDDDDASVNRIRVSKL